MIAFLKTNVYRVLSNVLAVIILPTLRALALLLIGFYRAVGSLWLSGSCRFEPSCSVYAQDAIERYGIWTGGKLAAIRLSRCRPGGPFGYDPVPDSPFESECGCHSN